MNKWTRSLHWLPLIMLFLTVASIGMVYAAQNFPGGPNAFPSAASIPVIQPIVWGGHKCATNGVPNPGTGAPVVCTWTGAPTAGGFFLCSGSTGLGSGAGTTSFHFIDSAGNTFVQQGGIYAGGDAGAFIQFAIAKNVIPSTTVTVSAVGDQSRLQPFCLDFTGGEGLLDGPVVGITGFGIPTSPTLIPVGSADVGICSFWNFAGSGTAPGWTLVNNAGNDGVLPFKVLSAAGSQTFDFNAAGDMECITVK